MTKALYADINLDFNSNPFTGDIIRAVNNEAIKKSFRNLILTNYYEVPFEPETGSNIRGSLFENFNPLGIEFMKSKIKELAQEKEPRVRIDAVNINQQQDYNTMQVSIFYTIIELNTTDSITVFVGRTK